MWLTWANVVTGVRALLALPCAWSAVQGHWQACAALLTLAVASDLIDGPLARSLQQSSKLGGLIDHATDATFIAVLLAALSLLGLLPWLLPLLVVASFLQYVADSEALRGRSLRTSRLGRSNGIGYFVLAATVVYREALGLAWPDEAWVQAFAWLLVFTTVASMLDRFRVWRTTE